MCLCLVFTLSCFCFLDFNESDDEEDEFKENNFKGNERKEKKKEGRSKTGFYIFLFELKGPTDIRYVLRCSKKTRLILIYLIF